MARCKAGAPSAARRLRSVVGVGDFNGDDVSDILFRNNATGDLGFYQMNGSGVLQGWRAIGGCSTAYHVAG